MRINGKRVIDAVRNMHIEINKTDARLGQNKNPSGCAAALAIVRSNKPYGAKQARVHLGRVYIEYPDHWVRYQTPQTLRAEIASFDRGTAKRYMVGEYTLYKPSPTARLGNPLGATSKGKKNVNKGRPTTVKGRLKLAIKQHRLEGVRQRGANR